MVGYVEGTILDLYCGTGSIGISFLKAGKGNKLVGIEIVEDAIIDARQNAKINGIDQEVIFLAAPAEKAFLQNPEIKEKLNKNFLIRTIGNALLLRIGKIVFSILKTADFCR